MQLAAESLAKVLSDSHYKRLVHWQWLSSRAPNAIVTIIMTCGVRCIQRVEWSIVPGLDDLVDLTVGLLIIEIVDLHRIVVAKILFTVHVACVSPCHDDAPLQLRTVLDRRLAVQGAPRDAQKERLTRWPSEAIDRDGLLVIRIPDDGVNRASS